MNAIGQDALDEKYRFGYSFKNPRVVKRVDNVKPFPWFEMDWATKGPTQVKEEMFRSGKLARYPSVWRRASKRMHRDRLGDIDERIIENRSEFERVELPDFQELGQAPGPTDKQGTTTGRDFFGVLTSTLTKASDILVAREQSKIAQAQAETSMRLSPGMFYQTAQDNWVWVVGGGLVLIGAYMLWRK